MLFAPGPLLVAAAAVGATVATEQRPVEAGAKLAEPPIGRGAELVFSSVSPPPERPLVVTGVVPKRVFMYWDDPNSIPKFVQANMALVRQLNPGWTLTLLTRGDYPMPDRPDSDETRHWMTPVADWTRVNALAEHGGVYLDASALARKPLETWVRNNSQLQGWTTPFQQVRQSSACHTLLPPPPRPSGRLAPHLDPPP